MTYPYSSFRSTLAPIYKKLKLLKVDDIYNLQIGKMIHKIYSGQSSFVAGFTLSLPRSGPCVAEDVIQRETGCDPALPAQLCWSSGRCFPHIRNTSIWTWFVIEITHQSRSKDAITFRIFRCPGVFAMISCWCCKFPIIAKSTQLMSIASQRPVDQGPNEGEASGAQFLGCGIDMVAPNACEGRWKVPTVSQVFSSIQLICFRKTSSSNMGAPNLFLALGAIYFVTSLLSTEMICWQHDWDSDLKIPCFGSLQHDVTS